MANRKINWKNCLHFANFNLFNYNNNKDFEDPYLIQDIKLPRLGYLLKKMLLYDFSN